jgi:mono/diheme cytochrome c family protein
MRFLKLEPSRAHSARGRGNSFGIASALLLLAPLLWAGSLAADGESGSALYEVEDGNKVDQKTLDGWKTWRALACERCHGAEQEGLVGPPLVERMKVLTKEEFHKVLMEGRIDKGMPPFNTSPMVNKNWEGLYAYLKGRADGKIKPGRLSAIGSP